jgi:hypothetical protein
VILLRNIALFTYFPGKEERERRGGRGEKEEREGGRRGRAGVEEIKRGREGGEGKKGGEEREGKTKREWTYLSIPRASWEVSRISSPFHSFKWCRIRSMRCLFLVPPPEIST